MTLSTPVKIVALAGLALVLAGGGMVFLFSTHGKPAAAAPPAAHTATVPVIQVHSTKVQSTKPSHPAKPKLQLDPNLPQPLLQGLQKSREVVAFVYSPQSATDRALLAEAKAGAKAAHVGFVALNAQNEKIADDVYFWASSSADPETFVVTRPGKIAWSLAGTIDRDAVAQAALGAP
jgi:hypothetical protein